MPDLDRKANDAQRQATDVVPDRVTNGATTRVAMPARVAAAIAVQVVRPARRLAVMNAVGMKGAVMNGATKGHAPVVLAMKRPVEATAVDPTFVVKADPDPAATEPPGARMGTISPRATGS